MTSVGSLNRASDLLVFAIDDRRYGLPAAAVVELHRSVAISPLPQPESSHLLEGVVDYHGQMAAVIDMRARFGHGHKPLAASDYFIFVRVDGNLLALRADKVLEIVNAPVEALTFMAAPANIPNQGHSVAGVCKLADGLVFIFDLQNFLNATESLDISQQLALALKLQEGEGEP